MGDDATNLLRELLCWHINGQGGLSQLRLLRERVVILTGRMDLADHDIHDIALRTHLIEAVQDWMEVMPMTD